MLFVSFLPLLAALAAGKPLSMPRLARQAAQPSFDVTLEVLGNTTVRAEVTNAGNEEVRLVRRGGILDPLPTKKVTVRDSNGSQLDFAGVMIHYVLSHLNGEAFVYLSPNQTVDSTFDVASMYNLSPGEEYTATAKGALEYTSTTNNATFQNYHYASNDITFTVPVNHNTLKARTTVECSNSDYNTKIHAAIERGAKMATAGAADARKGASDNFQKFFFTSDQDALDEVAGRLEAIAAETTSTGSSYYYCEPRDQQDTEYCSGNVAAFTVVQDNTIVNCDSYYDILDSSNSCSYLDQGGVVVHEYSHASQVYSPGTEDIVYGYEQVQALQDTEKALNNADSYAYYAAAIYLQCAADDSIMEGTPLDVDLGSSSSSSSTSSGSSAQGSSYAAPSSTGVPSTGSGSDSGSGSGGGWLWPFGQDSGSSGSSGSSSNGYGQGSSPTDSPSAPWGSSGQDQNSAPTDSASVPWGSGSSGQDSSSTGAPSSPWGSSGAPGEYEQGSSPSDAPSSSPSGSSAGPGGFGGSQMPGSGGFGSGGSGQPPSSSGGGGGGGGGGWAPWW
ncbi:Deuterolysin metalloprotease family-domain-containing protein [Aspergillus multicolor]|uniref:Deuterolysin metalloprotease family-domain-containing protein n=1 Tax=Aspergillus multicolor TaxID=41759 RepID=UPI003CCE07E4